ncbi:MULTISPECIES: DUF3285 domain-containing protein [Leptolyngbya]|jgi:hypothetical protein|uniref:DUF3285 domain-containing protein n=3 Tax=Leptolyngbya TaxID=47251 RepID=A0A1Z4JKM7_LEPBY|nr:MULTISPECIES: DUF3285 domain-containing protein [Leptolyngbya]WNZ46693.1 DUF3285 domain-containing protein [Leptolyngbya boryana CZ1]BAY57233.1 hypothetical protein NIES2135_40970 [Leptolyngbya boryana NIES-2135]
MTNRVANFSKGAELVTLEIAFHHVSVLMTDLPETPTSETPISETPKEPQPSYVKLAMRNMVRKRGTSIFHFALTTIGLLGTLVVLSYLTR